MMVIQVGSACELGSASTSRQHRLTEIFERITMKATNDTFFTLECVRSDTFSKAVADVNSKCLFECILADEISHFSTCVSRFFTLLKCFRFCIIRIDTKHSSLLSFLFAYFFRPCFQTRMMCCLSSKKWNTNEKNEHENQANEKNPEKFVVSLFSRTRAIYSKRIWCSCSSNSTKWILNSVTFHSVVQLRD